MTRKLAPNPTTGYLESHNSPIGLLRNTFTSERKQAVIALANKSIDLGSWPSLHSICREIGITINTFEVHYRKDPVFHAHWDEVKKRGLSLYTDKLASKAEGKMGTLANIAMLKWLEVGRWSPEVNGQLQQDISTFKKISDAIVVDIDPINDSKQVDNQVNTQTNATSMQQLYDKNTATDLPQKKGRKKRVLKIENSDHSNNVISLDTHSSDTNHITSNDKSIDNQIVSDES